MSTNAVIGLLTDNKVVAVCLHWDGYPDHAGKILLTNYNTTEQLQELLSFGEISSIASTIEDSVFYHRDKGEDLYIEENLTVDQFNKLREGSFHYLFDVDTGEYVK